MKLSIIVPVYNVEQYIIKCISSLLNQNFNDYEIIIVNDGTKDNSINLIQQNFNDQRIKIVNQENKGLSAARNTGLSKAVGNYIWFFDSDDWAEENVLTKIVPLLNNCDLVYFNSFYEEYDDRESKLIQNIMDDCSTGRELSMKKHQHCVPYYIYQRTFLEQNKLHFEEGIYHEDTLFTPCTLYQAEHIRLCKVPAYHRLLREGSITHSINYKKCFDLCLIIDKLMIFSNSIVNANDRFQWGNCIADATNELLFLTFNYKDIELLTQVKKYINQTPQIIPYLQHAKKINTKLLGFISHIYGNKLFETYSFLYHFRYKLFSI